ncbi:MAG: hypothetical protein AUI10_13145 [Actinobacteria bacterium 13_2_20CM_2_72_6]|nr:MAG: hypothetical protein AUI10_13145 [Actinobacteria bacterium 13_2_20CM_2_72_6]
MSREAVDETLAGLGAAHDRIAAAMFTIDSHPALAYLRGGGLAGLTQARWAALQPEVDRLWAQFAVLGDLLERARGIRGQRRPDDDDWAALRLMCGEPVVALDATGMPAEAGNAAPAARVRLWDLAGQLERRCATVTGHLSDVDSSWSVVAGRYAPLTQDVDALVAQAASVGLADAAEPLSATLAEVARSDLGDPLSAAPGGRLSASAQVRLDGVVARMAQLRDRVGQLVGIRDGYPRRVAELRALVDAVATAEERLTGSYARAVDRIADTGLPPVPEAARVLQGRLADLDRLHREGRWGPLVDAAATLERSATRARARADELREAADGLLARRDELRGRLEAYRAKAATLGYAEDEELTELHTRARELLYTAPCDLRAATRATFAYQQALAGRTARPGQGGDDDDR